jgi:hypothetical protein
MADFNGTAGNDAIQPFGSSLLLTLSGSAGEGGIYPVINVVVNGQTLVSGLTISANNATGGTQTVAVPLPAGLTPSSIVLDYTNDTQTTWANGDRNLYVSSVMLDGVSLPVTSGSYLRTADNTVVPGQSDMVWGGTLTFSGTVVANAAAHVITGGNVTVDGLGGLDTAFFTHAKASYSITSGASGTTVSGNGETATLTNIERLHFTDASVAYDMTGNAGTVAHLLKAVFGAASLGNAQYVGLGLQAADSGLSEAQLASLAVTVPSVANLSNADFVKALYHNVAGVDPSPDVQASYAGQLDSHSATRADFALLASHLVGVSQTSLDYV